MPGEGNKKNTMLLFPPPPPTPPPSIPKGPPYRRFPSGSYASQISDMLQEIFYQAKTTYFFGPVDMPLYHYNLHHNMTRIL